MTNLLFAVVVTLQTNVVQSNNASGCKGYEAGGVQNGMLLPNRCHAHGDLWWNTNCQPYKPATERTETTVVTYVTNAVHGRWSVELGACSQPIATNKWVLKPGTWVEAKP